MAVQIAQRSATESELIEKARAGEPEGIAGLYQRHATPIFRLALRLTASEVEAEDVVHDLFVALPEALRRYDERGSFASWLKRVAVRHTLMQMRRNRRRREVSLDAARTEPATERSETAAETWDLRNAIGRLPDPLRSVIVLKQMEGYSHKEIASLLGITPGASRVRFARAVKLLRERLR